MHETSRTVLDLNEGLWSVTDGCGTYQLNTKLPSYPLEVLHSAGLIEDPLYRFNDIESRWVAEETWILKRDFLVTSDVYGRACVELTLEGIDTVADVLVNGKFITQIKNAFRQYRLPVKQLVHEGSNSIELVFHPAISESQKRAAVYPYVVPSMQGPGMLPHYNFLRKPACDFGWDWGPAFAACGVYGKVALEAYSTPQLIDAVVHHEVLDGSRVRVVVDAFVSNPHPSNRHAVLSISFENNAAWGSTTQVMLPPGGISKHSLACEVQGVNLWWPVGYGKPHLYNVKLTLGLSEDPEGWEVVPPTNGMSSMTKRIGFRKVELVRQPLEGGKGESFFLKVNGLPIYAKGANIVPPHVLHSHASDQKLRELVDDAAAAHMNMLRVWGGGLYFPGSFYTTCDEAGIMVWQEAMFACSPYPRDADFVQEIEREVEFQCKRLGSHPCIVVWGGNNEVEQSLEWFEATRAAPYQYVVDYSDIFVVALRRQVKSVLPNAIYVDGSPSNSEVSQEPYAKRWGGATKNINDPNYGDVHFYNYKDDVLDPAIYPPAKFLSEFGFMSYPSWESYRAVTAEEDWALNSKMSEHRMRHPNGNEELLHHLSSYFKLPQGLQDPQGNAETFRKWIYLTQVLQSCVYSTAICKWRRLRSDPIAMTMGVLYWQLNDVWQGPSWSSINADGRWKLLHHTAQHFFAPQLLTGLYNKEEGTVEVWAVNDTPDTMTGTLEVQIIPWAATIRDDVMVASSLPVDVAPLSSQKLVTVQLSGLRNHAGEPVEPTSVFALATFATSTPGDALFPDGRTGRNETQTGPSTSSICSAPILTTPVKDAPLQAPEISIQNVQQTSEKEVSFTLGCTHITPFVALESSIAGRFSDNNMLLLPWHKKYITFKARVPNEKLQHFRDDVSVMSMHDAQQ